MQVETIKEGIVRVKPIERKPDSIIVTTGPEEKLFHRGVVQSIGSMSPKAAGFIEGDEIYYTEPLPFIGGTQLVFIENVVLVVCAK